MKSTFTTSSHVSAEVARPVGTRESRRHEIRFKALRGLMFAGACTLGTIAGSGTMLTHPIAKASDCDCWDSACDACSSRGNAMNHNLLYRSLDSLAGGIEKVLGLDKSVAGRCDEFGCDDVCDAGTMQHLMLPMEPLHIQTAPPTYRVPQSTLQARPAPFHAHPPAATQIVPSPVYDSYLNQSSPYVPTPHDALEGQYVSPPQVGQPHASEVPMPQPLPPSETIDAMPPRNGAAPQPVPEPQPNKDGSLFDNLGDPFGDDEVRNYRPYRNVRPSGYLQRAGSVSGQSQGGTLVRPSVPTPARKATHRTSPPVLNTPIRQTSRVDQMNGIDHQPVGSGVARTSATLPTSTMPSSTTKAATSVPASRPSISSKITELTPTDYLSSSRSASKFR